MYYSSETLIKAYNKGEKFKFLFFWGHTPSKDKIINASCLSQWWMCDFVVEGVKYCCAEQYMMAKKAELFQDSSMLKEILNAAHPKQMKAFGRLVNNFEKEKWDENCYNIVKEANKAKFSQNLELWAFLKNTKSRILVEASPRDRIWGIGMEKLNPDAENPTKWRGKNLLGFAITQIRDELLKSENS